jgi:S-disulfanyl-L-cysteine oxidoreductase SoxD
MFKCRDAWTALLIVGLGAFCASASGAKESEAAGLKISEQANALKSPVVFKQFDGIGRAATPKEIAAWDIDVRPDFKGLPQGRGSVAQGQVLWEAKCESCHGVFGESNAVFNPIIGGTTAADMTAGRVANLAREYPGRTTMMKLASLSTLWDYINRAMPWTAPKSLKTDEVYALSAYILHLGGVVDADFVLSDSNMQAAQNRLPNRHGMSTQHALWPGSALDKTTQAQKPDVKATACMRHCAVAPRVDSILPDHARNTHGNLAEQNRLVGAQRGANTLVAESPRAFSARAPLVAEADKVQALAASAVNSKAVLVLLQKNHCTACHGMSSKLVGPSFKDIAQKHAGKIEHLAEKIRAGGAGVWGGIPMPSQSLPVDESNRIAAWLAEGAK